MRKFFILMVIGLLAAASFGAVEIQRNDFYQGADVLEEVQLPAPESQTEYSFDQLLEARGGEVRVRIDDLSLSQLSRIFYAGYGITDEVLDTRSVQSYDDAYSLLLYLVTDSSVYVYVPASHSLAKIIDTDVRSRLARAAARDTTVMAARNCIVIAGSPKIAGFKRPRDGRKYMLIEAGRVMQNMELEGLGERIGFLVIDNFDEAKISYLLRMPVGFEPVSILAVGDADVSLEAMEPAEKPVEVKEKAANEQASQPAEDARGSLTLAEVQSENRNVDQQQAEEPMARVLIYLPSNYFPEEPVAQMMNLFEFNNVEVDTVAMDMEAVRGDRGTEVRPDVTINNAMVNNYDVVMFVGASKVISASRNYSSLDNFAYRAWDSGAIIAAYGQGVEVLARARILDGGVEVTGDIRSRRVVRGYGGEFINEPLVVDGRFVTAQPQVTNLETGPVGAMGLANEILGLLKQQQESENDRE